MTTLQDLIDRAGAFDRDIDQGFITPQNYLAWYNEAQADIAARLQLFEEEIADNIDALGEFPFPTDPGLLEIMELVLGDDDRVRFVGSAEFNGLKDSAANPTSTVARLFDNSIEFYPVPAEGTVITLRFKRLLPVAASAEDVIELPRHLERKAVEYMKAQAAFKAMEMEQGTTWMALYEQGMPALSTGRERLFNRPLALTRRLNTWDLQSDRSHI